MTEHELENKRIEVVVGTTGRRAHSRDPDNFVERAPLSQEHEREAPTDRRAMENAEKNRRGRFGTVPGIKPTLHR